MAESTTASKVLDSNLFLATLSGLYLWVFFSTNNLTMLSFASLAAIAVAFIAPPVLMTGLSGVAAQKLAWDNCPKFSAVFVSVAWVTIALHAPVFYLESLQPALAAAAEIHRMVAPLVWTVMSILLALIAAWLFRNDSRVLAVMICVMTLVSLVTAAPVIRDRLIENDMFGAATSNFDAGNVDLAHRPNIYLILADGYVNFAHLHDQNLASAEFENYLSETDFTLYGKFLSNYHPTTASMTAILDMRHHYYVGSRKFGEITSAGRASIGGRNLVVELLRRNGYSIHYTHQGIYLLTQGCTADTCFPDQKLDGARIILRSAIPWLSAKMVEWATVSLATLQEEVERSVTKSQLGMPQFHYIHLYKPFHVPNNVQGVCDESRQSMAYGKRLDSTNRFLEQLIDKLVQQDPGAVIALVGDHGPMISNRCDWTADIGSEAEYSDRLGAILAIRWPEHYDGRYDDRIKTSINLFRYLLASLAKNDKALLDSLVTDDVYAQGSNGKLKIMSEGQLLMPPEKLSDEDMFMLWKTRQSSSE